ncbi:MAG: hypothetical protein J6K84_00920 [Oscillospiraceae bacterium]|nr:hypothetical protein [Oscillospiraceae bacterium]
MKKITLLIVMLLCIAMLASCGEKPATTPPADDNVAVSGDCTITVDNDDSKGSIAFTDAEGKTMASCKKGDTVTITVTPKVDYAVKSFTINGKELALNNGSITLQVNGNFQIATTYEEVTYTRATDPILEERRNKAEASMRAFCSTLFVYDRDLPYAARGADHSMVKDTIYRGVPYNNGNISLEGYLNYVKTTENGINYMDTDRFVDRYGMMMGGSCADAVYWAWSEISDSLTFRWASESSPNRGCLIVGDWTYHGATEYGDTHAIVAENGTEVMFKSYAQLLKADGISFQNKGAGAHIAMIVENHIEYNADGTINGDYSYVTYHDTNGYTIDVEVELPDGEVVTAKSTTQVDCKASYNILFSRGYVPITILELVDRNKEVTSTKVEDSKAGELNADNVLKGVISCNYYMDYHTMVITDKAGNVVQKAVRQSYEMNHKDFDVKNFGNMYFDDNKDVYELYVGDDKIDLDALSAGTYHCTLTSHIGNGEEIVVRDFDFTV